MTKWKQRRREAEKQRNHVATQAMVGLFSANPLIINELINATNGSGSISELAYHMADAMKEASKS